MTNTNNFCTRSRIGVKRRNAVKLVKYYLPISTYNNVNNNQRRTNNCSVFTWASLKTNDNIRYERQNAYYKEYTTLLYSGTLHRKHL